jgi:hypothetical protein
MVAGPILAPAALSIRPTASTSIFTTERTLAFGTDSIRRPYAGCIESDETNPKTPKPVAEVTSREVKERSLEQVAYEEQNRYEPDYVNSQEPDD